MIKFKSFSSGSAGNCYFLGIFSEEGRPEAAILIDAGVSIKRLKLELSRDGLTLDDFSAVLVTHDHFDHIRSLGSYCKRLARPVWATRTLHNALMRHAGSAELVPPCRRILADDAWTDVVPGRISVRPFVVPHDASQTVGFAICLDGFRYVHITDCGRLPEQAMQFLKQADAVVLESNYDLKMLREGPYTLELQDRICGGNGHLSNAECAAAVGEFWHEGLRSIFLCHLSENNNTPELAYAASRRALDAAEAAAGAVGSCRLQTLPRQSAIPLINL